jgi:hypothetical protein
VQYYKRKINEYSKYLVREGGEKKNKSKNRKKENQKEKVTAGGETLLKMQSKFSSCTGTRILNTGPGHIPFDIDEIEGREREKKKEYKWLGINVRVFCV